MPHTQRIAVLGTAAIFVMLLHQGESEKAHAYVEIPYSLGRILAESTTIAVLRVESVDKQKNTIIYRKVQDLKGKTADVVRHNIGRAGFHPREWQITMEWAEPGKTAVFFTNGGASETCIHNYWYQAYAGGEWWNMSHSEPFLLRSFAGKPEKLATAVTQLLAGQEAVVTCMVDGNKNDLQLRTAKMQRMRASLKLQDYNPKRDFVGWGGEEEMRPLAGMPGFTHLAGLGRTDPGALGVAAADIDGDGKMDFCLYGEGRVVVYQNGGPNFSEVPLPITGGARSAAWGDFNGDKKPDLLLATPTGPKLLANTGSGFRDETAALPREAYYNLTSAAWIDADADGHQDILLANGFHGLRLYRNKGAINEPASPKVVLGKWHMIGPFDNTGRRAFDVAYPPEKEIDLKQTYVGKNDVKVAWRAAEFPDGQGANLMGHFKDNQFAVAYFYREIETPAAVDMPLSLGSDDTLTVWLNGQRVLAVNEYRGAAPDQNKVTLKLKPGKNQLLMKICQGDGDWAFFFTPSIPPPPIPLRFDDATARFGLTHEQLGATAKGDHLLVADFDADGRQDCLFSCGEGMLLMNKPEGFRAAKDHGIRLNGGKLAPIAADINGDGSIDVLALDRAGCKLFLNNGKFRDATPQSGILGQPIPNLACAAICDPDGDGKRDLFIGCVRGANRFLRNDNGVFRDVSSELGLEQRLFNTRGALVADLNRDGAPDFILNNEGQDSVLLLGNASVWHKPAGDAPAPFAWPTHRGDVQRTGCPDNLPGPKNPKALWTHRGNEHYIAAPVPDGKHLYVSSLGAFNSASFRALSLDAAAKERTAWSMTVPLLKQPVVSAPAVSQGMVIFGDGMHQTDGAVLRGLSTVDGFPIWELELPGKLVHLEGGPAVDGNRVYIGGGNGGVFCVDLTTFRVGDADVDRKKAEAVRRAHWDVLQRHYADKKKLNPNAPDLVPPSLDQVSPATPKIAWQSGKDRWHVDAPINVVGDFVLVGSAYLDDEKVGERTINCLSKSNGSVVWRHHLKYNPWAGVTVAGDVVLVGTSSCRLDPNLIDRARGEVLAFDLKTGKPLWQKEYRGGVLSPIACRNGLAIFTCTDGRVRALDIATGTPKWSYDPLVPFFAGPAVSSEGVYVADLKGVVHALNFNDGVKRWTFDLAAEADVKAPGMVFASPVLFGGKLYVATTNHEGQNLRGATVVVCIGEKP
jgi:outer membrane protein assembly factor BamB